MMKDEEEKVDSLLGENTAERLAGVNWDELNAAISSRLDEAQRAEAAVIGFPRGFKVGAAVAAAAVIFIAMIVLVNRPEDVKPENGSRAVVKFIETKGTASVEIEFAEAKGQAVVDINPSRIRFTQCDVKIIDVNGGRKKAEHQPSWIIVKRAGLLLADNGVDTDMMDMICLF